MDPATIAMLTSAGIGLARSVFGGPSGVRVPHIDPFSFNPNENDPQLALMRRRALFDQQASSGRTVDELSRAGLLGSSAAYGVLGANEAQGARTQEDITNEAFNQQRLQALQLYRDNAQFLREKALAEAGYSAQEHQQGLGALGDLGTSLGMGLVGKANTAPMSLEEYLKKKQLLEGNNFPYQSILDASQYTPDYPNRRSAL